MKKENIFKEIHLLRFVNFILYACLLGFLALGLPQKICSLNSFQIDCVYGQWAFFVVVSILSVVFLTDLKFFIKQNEKTTKNN